MTADATSPRSLVTTDLVKALGDPIRWHMIQQLSRHPELPCSVLEASLPVSKPTVSYHTKILARAGLIEARKVGRSVVYALRREALRNLLDALGALAPGHRAAGTETDRTACPGPHSIVVSLYTAQEAAPPTW